MALTQPSQSKTYANVEMKQGEDFEITLTMASPWTSSGCTYAAKIVKDFSDTSFTGPVYTAVSSTAATATITITDFTELNAGDKVNLVATDGNNYDFTNGDQSSVNGTWESTTSNDATATNLMNVINTSSGPSGTRFTATVSGAVITVTQATVGTDGNTTVTLTDSSTAGMTKTNFTGAAIISDWLGGAATSVDFDSVAASGLLEKDNSGNFVKQAQGEVSVDSTATPTF